MRTLWDITLATLLAAFLLAPSLLGTLHTSLIR